MNWTTGCPVSLSFLIVPEILQRQDCPNRSSNICISTNI